MGKKVAIRWKKSLVFNIGLVLAVMVNAEAKGAENSEAFELSPEQLFGATVISVSKTAERLIDAPAAIYVLTNEEIMRSGATSVPEALREVPGVQVAQVNATGWAVSVRGFNSGLADKLLVLIDGREIYDPLFSGVYWDVQNLMLEDIDRIEVVRGPGASLYGANAVNGVINIITKKSSETQGNLLSVTAGSGDHAIVGERYGGTLGDNGSYRIYGKYTDLADGQTQSGRDAHDGQMDQRGGFRADWTSPSSHDDFTFQGDVFRSTDGDLRGVPTFTTPFSTVVPEDIMAAGADMQGRWNHSFADDSRLTLQSYVDYDVRNQVILGDARTSFDFDAQYELPQKDIHKIIVGGGYRYSHDQLTASPYATFTSTGQNTNLISSFVQDKITLDPNNWFLTLGTKLERNDYTGFEIQPNARLQWLPDETQSVWASIARALRTPSRLEEALTINEGVLSLGGFPAELRLVPNTGFESEKLVAFEVGYRKQFTPEITLDATAYYNDYSQLATDSFLTPHLTPPFLFPFTNTNATSGQTRGLEIAPDWRVRPDLDLGLAYSLLDMRLHGPNSGQAINSEIAGKEVPTQQLNLRARWNVTQNLTFDPTLYYTGAQRALGVPEYWLLNTRLGWKIVDGLQVSLVGQDLLHGSHREFTSSNDTTNPVIGRSFYGNLTWRF